MPAPVTAGIEARASPAPTHRISRVIARAPETSERVALPGPAKVPRLTPYFWVIKILTTALGEATSDYLVHNVNPYLAVFGGFLTFLAAMAIQFHVRTYLPWAYWLAVTMVAVFGTMAADVLHVEFGVPYVASTVFFAITLAVVFVTWYRTEGTLSIKSVYAGRREVFYWAAVLATFAMGTAAGDLAAYTLGLGFLTAGLFFAAMFAVPVLGYRYLGLNAIFAFWFAYILTRPLGASFADWMGKSRTAGGLGWGDGPVSACLAVTIVLLVAYLTVTGNDQPDARTSPRRGEPGQLRSSAEQA
jgi:uncharacterized membrane-anchored protein